MATAQQTSSVIPMRKPLPPAHGKCRWLIPLRDGEGRIRITVYLQNGEELIEEYAVGAEYDREGRGTIVAFNLCRMLLDDLTGKITFTHYTVHTVGAWHCDCPDATHRPERRHNCKHTRALRAALAKLPF